MRKLKRLVRKNKKLILRVLAFGVALEAVLMAALLLDIPTSTEGWMAAEVGRVNEGSRIAQNDLAGMPAETAPGDEAALEEEALSGAGLDDSMYVDPVIPEEGAGLAEDGELLPTPEPYDFGSGSAPSFEDLPGDYPAPGDDGTGGSYNDDYPADDGEGEIGADFDDYGDTAGCDGDCDDYTDPTDPIDVNPGGDTVIPTPIPVDTQAPAQPTAVSPTKAPTAKPTSTPGSPGPQPTPTNPPVQPTQPAVTGGLVAVPAGEAPKLDGQSSDSAWAAAPELTIQTAGGANDSAATVTLRSVYTSQYVYFLISWEDPTNSWLRNPWEKQPDGSWKLLIGSENEGSDENQFYEDKLALLWPVNDSIPGFTAQGCGTACHLGEGGDGKPLGSMHTNGRDELADLWNWKSYRNLGQMDDLYLNNDDYKRDYWAGFQKDPSDGGGYRSNITENGKLPAYMPPGGGSRDGQPGFIFAPQAEALDDSLFQPGDRLPSVLAEPFLGDRGSISAGWTYANGRWTLEISRPLVTGSGYDVQFDDLNRVYYFALATFDNTQIRHAAQAGATPFRFQK